MFDVEQNILYLDVLIIKNENNQLAQINFNFSADNLLLLLPSKQGNKPRLALDQFQKSHQQQIVRFRCVQNDRVMLIELANGSLFYACFYGRRADVIYLKDEEYDSFRVKDQTIDLIKKMESPNIEFDANNWDEFWQVVKGHGPMNKERMKARVGAWEHGEWVRDAAMAYAEKQQNKKENQAKAV